MKIKPYTVYLGMLKKKAVSDYILWIHIYFKITEKKYSQHFKKSTLLGICPAGIQEIPECFLGC